MQLAKNLVPVYLSEIPITQELVRYLFDYNSVTGELTWKNPPGNIIKKGQNAYSPNNKYYTVEIYDKNYRAHRIVWLYVHGYLPEYEIDHKDRNGQNNKLKNLREASRQCNMRNVGLRTNNKSHVVGVSFNQRSIKWYANIMVNKKTYNLGYYSDYIEAACARLAAEQCLNWSNCDTDSTAAKCIKSWLNKRVN